MAEAGVPNIVVRDRPRATVCRSSGTGARGVVCPVYPLTGCVEDLDIYRYAVAYAVAHDAEILELLRAPVEMRDFGDGIAQMNAGMKSADAQAAFFVAHERAAYFGAQLAWTLLELAHAEEQARRQAIAHRSGKEPLGVGARAAAERSTGIQSEIRNGRPIESKIELVVLPLLELHLKGNVF